MMRVLSSVSRFCFTKSKFPSPSPCGCSSARSPFATIPSKRRKRKATPKAPKSKYEIDAYIDELEDGNKSFPNITVLASPLVHIFSVSIDTNFDDDDRPCELYGSIRATGSTAFTLYDRNRGNPETIVNKRGNYLSLIGPRPQNKDDLPCSLGTTTTKIELDLKDKTQSIELIKSDLILDSNTEEIDNSYDKLKTAVVAGAEHGCFASVKYATFRFAVFAYVETAIYAKYDVSRPVSEIYGSIVAGYANSKSYECRKGDTLSSMKSTLFNRPPDQPEQATVCTPISLSRCVVAVPAHSSLKIEAHLWDRSVGGPFVSGSVEFLGPHNARTKLIRGEGGSLVVSVAWDNAFQRAQELRDFKFYPDYHDTLGQEGEGEGEGEEEREGEGGDHPPNNKALMLQNKPLPSSTRALRLRGIYATKLVEVLSILVDSQANDVPAICGSIEIDDCHRIYIYHRDVSDPEFCSADNRMIPLECHRTLEFCDYFGIGLCLKDPVLDVVISNGGVMHYGPIGRTFAWYDNRLCSVIQGRHGYVAMHYIVFSKACTALIEMTIISSDDDHHHHHHSVSAPTSSPFKIYGRVFAQYKSEDYSSVYAKKYYRSRLFDKPESESVELTTTQSKLPLLRSAVSVPINDSLIIQANLYATTNNGNPKDEAVFGTVEFEADDNYCTIQKRIQRQRYCIQISVQMCFSSTCPVI